MFAFILAQNLWFALTDMSETSIPSVAAPRLFLFCYLFLFVIVKQIDR